MKPILTCLLAFSLFAFASAEANDYTTQSPPALVIDDQTFDPICFLNDWSNAGPEPDIQGVSFYPLDGCRIGEIVVDPVEHDANPDYIGASYAEDFYDPETDEVNTYRGYIAYRYVGDYKGKKAIIKVENGGGSGIFSDLSLYELREHEMADGTKKKVLQHLETIAGGDRCNGGITEASTDDNTLTYSVNVTPYDMLFLAGHPERDILKSPEAEQVVSCSICCYAHAHFNEERFTGMSLNKDNLERLAPEEESVMGCIDNLVKLNAELGAGTFDAESTEIFIHEIEHTCLGRMEGE